MNNVKRYGKQALHAEEKKSEENGKTAGSTMKESKQASSYSSPS